jgi:hypothetical protein
MGKRAGANGMKYRSTVPTVLLTWVGTEFVHGIDLVNLPKLTYRIKQLTALYNKLRIIAITMSGGSRSCRQKLFLNNNHLVHFPESPGTPQHVEELGIQRRFLCTVQYSHLW